MAGNAVRHGGLMVSVNESSLTKQGVLSLLYPPQQMPPLGYLSQRNVSQLFFHCYDIDADLRAVLNLAVLLRLK